MTLKFINIANDFKLNIKDILIINLKYYINFIRNIYIYFKLKRILY
jgi:hypothetical protein